MDWVRHLMMAVEEHTSFGGVGLVIAAVMLVVGRLVLPRAERRALRFPLVTLCLHLMLIGLSIPVPKGTARGALELSALFLLLISIGRSGFLLVVSSGLAQRVLARSLPRIIRDILQGTIYAVALIVTLRAAGVEPGSLLTTSALLTAVIGLSLQDTLGNLFAGLAIQAQRPFEVGDWIQFDPDPENIGMVVEINWRAAKVLTIEQVEVTVPNSSLAKTHIRNFTKPTGEARRSVQIHAPFHVPVRTVQRLLLEAIRDVKGVLDRPEPSVVPKAFDERGVLYEVRYFVHEFQRRDVIAGDVRDRIWYALRRQGVEIPAPRRLVQMREATAVEVEREQEMRERERHLQRVDFLRELPDGALHDLAEMSETRLYDQGEAIIHQDEEGQELFILRRGEVAVILEGKGRRSASEVARLSPGQFFGEMSLMTGEPRRATVRATQESEVLVVGKLALQRVFEDHPDLVERISRVLAEREELLDQAEEERASQRAASEHGHDRRNELLGKIRDFFSM